MGVDEHIKELEEQYNSEPTNLLVGKKLALAYHEADRNDEAKQLLKRLGGIYHQQFGECLDEQSKLELEEFRSSTYPIKNRYDMILGIGASTFLGACSGYSFFNESPVAGTVFLVSSLVATAYTRVKYKEMKKQREWNASKYDLYRADQNIESVEEEINSFRKLKDIIDSSEP